MWIAGFGGSAEKAPAGVENAAFLA